MPPQTVDYALFEKLCALQDRDEDTVPPGVRFTLESVPLEWMGRMREFLVALQEVINALPLGTIRELKGLQAAWLLTELAGPSTKDFLRCSDPEGGGIPCLHAGVPFVLTQDHVYHLYRVLEHPLLGELWHQLVCWQSTLCCYWGVRLLEPVVTFANKKRLLPPTTVVEALPYGDFSEDTTPLGMVLAFSGASADQLVKAHDIARGASLGSASCEDASAHAFRDWLKRKPLSTLREYGITTIEEAHRLLSATGQSYARFDIMPRWNGHAYEMVSRITNRTATGFRDDDYSPTFPSALAWHFFEESPLKIKEDMTRLLIRAMWRKGSDLLFRMF